MLMFQNVLRSLKKPIWSGSIARISDVVKPPLDDADKLFAIFPESAEEKIYVERTADELYKMGFSPTNTMACVAACRDELCQPLLNHIDKAWRTTHNYGGVHFLLSSVGGMVFLGKTGFEAAISHAPRDQSGLLRFVFYAFPHISIAPSGEVGKALRPGRTEETEVCGALCRLRADLSSGTVNSELDWADAEHSLLKQRMLLQLDPANRSPTLPELTMSAYQAILKDTKRLIEECLPRATGQTHGQRVDYVVLSGVQIHMPSNLSYIWPGESYMVINDNKQTINPWKLLEDIPATMKLNRTIYDDPRQDY